MKVNKAWLKQQLENLKSDTGESEMTTKIVKIPEELHCFIDDDILCLNGSEIDDSHDMYEDFNRVGWVENISCSAVDNMIEILKSDKNKEWVNKFNDILLGEDLNTVIDDPYKEMTEKQKEDCLKWYNIVIKGHEFNELCKCLTKTPEWKYHKEYCPVWKNGRIVELENEKHKLVNETIESIHDLSADNEILKTEIQRFITDWEQVPSKDGIVVADEAVERFKSIINHKTHVSGRKTKCGQCGWTGTDKEKQKHNYEANNFKCSVLVCPKCGNDVFNLIKEEEDRIRNLDKRD